MSTTYEEKAGIGYFVDITENISEDVLEWIGDGECLDEYVYREIIDSGKRDLFKSNGIGGEYVGYDKLVFISIKDPFHDGLDLSEKKAQLEQFIESIGLEIHSDMPEFGVCSGVYAY